MKYSQSFQSLGMKVVSCSFWLSLDNYISDNYSIYLVYIEKILTIKSKIINLINFHQNNILYIKVFPDYFEVSLTVLYKFKLSFEFYYSADGIFSRLAINLLYSLIIHNYHH